MNVTGKDVTFNKHQLEQDMHTSSVLNSDRCWHNSTNQSTSPNDMIVTFEIGENTRIVVFNC